MQTIEQWLVQATAQLTHAQILTARLDVEVILAHALGANRTWLITHNNDTIDDVYTQKADTLLEKRLRHCPIAYLTNSKEFYGRKFAVSPDVLIPRPETEDLVELTLTTLGTQGQSLRLVDVGTGSGCLGITLKLERPELDVTLCDISEPVLAIAHRNAENLGADVQLMHSDLLAAFSTTSSSLLPYSKIQNLKSTIHFIVANLPYVDTTWQRSPETDHEPSLALFAKDGGLELIKKLIEQSYLLLQPGSLLLLEADPVQHPTIQEYARKYNYEHLKTLGYAIGFVKKS